ncbi:acyltransferase [Ulvibacter antarcticus]|uniref:Transferase family hexapeptide repeat protein n=1 Tax=Ulvibacter antarcticus TaxID=442714 RepID=A0A3L9YHT8_9FLAO|nr:acyltransferase [Ulvibacter antarcticus]RMA58950.1 transferase family hexapeptide repeat protein [Ulvibacter antarcticus]
MIRFLKIFSFIPFIKRLVYRKYYATGLGTYIVNSFYKVILRINAPADFLCHFTSRVNSPKKIKFIGSDLSSQYLSMATSGGCYYQALNGIVIGEGTIWSYNCCFVSANHSFLNLTKHTETEPIRIGERVWLGANCVVLPSVSIGDYSIIGASSLVSKDIPEYTIAVGNPARVIAKRCKICLSKIKLEENCPNCS